MWVIVYLLLIMSILYYSSFFTFTYAHAIAYLSIFKHPDIFCPFKRIRVKTFAKYACLLARNEGIITDRTAPCYSFNDSDDKIIKQ